MHTTYLCLYAQIHTSPYIPLNPVWADMCTLCVTSFVSSPHFNKEFSVPFFVCVGLTGYSHLSSAFLGGCK